MPYLPVYGNIKLSNILTGGETMSNHLKLLIAEDTEELNRETANVFKDYSIDTSFAPKDGLKVLETIERTSPDVVIMDLFMPHIDAIGVIKTVKKNSAMKSPMFIISSSFDSPVLEQESITAGASYFVLKPFNAKDLAERIINTNLVDEVNKVKPSLPDVKANCNMELEVTEILHQIGVPAHIKGYHYLRDSIIMSVENPDIINAVTKQLYPSVAKRFSTTSSRVERAIRHAIEVAWDRGDVDVLNSYFGYTIHNGRGKPTNSEFIAMISDKLRLQIKSAS